MDREVRPRDGTTSRPPVCSVLFEHLPVFAYSADLLDKRLLCVGKRVADLLGYDASDVTSQGLKFFECHTHPNDLVRHRDWSYADLGEGEVIDRECRMRHHDGRWRWVRRREVVTERDASGAPTQILGIAEDVTERKLSERHLVRHHERLLQLLAYDIHDGLVQDIVGAQMALETVIECVAPIEADCVQELILLRGLLRKAIGEGRRMITTLRPMIIDEMGVVEAINYLVAEEQSIQRLNVTFVHDVEFDRLAPMLEGMVFRIVQESLSNVRRHAGVQDAEVRLQQTGSMFQIQIEDRGAGFDISQIGDHHFGLEGIRERARLLGGKATIHSVVGQGTIVSVMLPIELPPEWHEESSSLNER
ncbi:MAG: PAS domain-containing sensor histidine kinase [Planctomycetaceae bacterium]|nr:PAS domain-containing protein [Planctomycetales bacterium]MCB9927600.1 PAS domain-containing sensor histidine kinase [Planctomycetaceae bacterium]